MRALADITNQDQTTLGNKRTKSPPPQCKTAALKRLKVDDHKSAVVVEKFPPNKFVFKTENELLASMQALLEHDPPVLVAEPKHYHSFR